MTRFKAVAKVKRFSCEDLAELTPLYLDDALDTPAREGFDHHLAECLTCAGHVTGLRVTVDTLGDLPAGPAETLSERTRGRLLSAFRASRHP
ncbi:anti-sigma factor family protein [Sphaerisporangium aureirubrum]|uniref:Anti-sigma factor family protein n=1 Tax=Sphaerisporangium aureirubrum TaxID=1544736 RepID=A0ABW1NV81_9ACTN